MKERLKINPLLVLRGFAATAILLYHMQYPWVEIPTILNMDLKWITSANGFVFVWVFFILSGYLAGKGFNTHRYSYTVKSLIRYILKRFLRIAPYYYVIVIVNYFISGLWLAADGNLILWKALSFTASDQIIRPGVDYLWAISTEMQWYILVPFISFIVLKWLKVKRRGAVILSLTIICFVFLLRQYSLSQSYPQWFAEYLLRIYSPLIYNLDFFLAGLLINLMISPEYINESMPPKQRLSSKLMILSAACAVCLLYVASSYIRYYTILNFPGYIYFQAIVLPVLTVILIGYYIYISERYNYRTSYTNHNILIPLWKSIGPAGIFQWLGIYSFELYLVHLPLMNMLGLHCLHNTYGCTVPQFLWRFPALLLSSFVCAWLLHVTVGMFMSRLSGMLKLLKRISL
jgi:peptidoglycan/LPS O-acetylase OafA/YrhL